MLKCNMAILKREHLLEAWLATTQLFITLHNQYFAAINTTNTSVVDASAAASGILGFVLPVNLNRWRYSWIFFIYDFSFGRRPPHTSDTEFTGTLTTLGPFLPRPRRSLPLSLQLVLHPLRKLKLPQAAVRYYVSSSLLSLEKTFMSIKSTTTTSTTGNVQLDPTLALPSQPSPI